MLRKREARSLVYDQTGGLELLRKTEAGMWADSSATITAEIIYISADKNWLTPLLILPASVLEQYKVVQE